MYRVFRIIDNGKLIKLALVSIFLFIRRITFFPVISQIRFLIEFSKYSEILSSPYPGKTAKFSLSLSYILISPFLTQFQPIPTTIELNRRYPSQTRGSSQAMLAQSWPNTSLIVRIHAYMYSWTLLIRYPLLNARHILIVLRRRNVIHKWKRYFLLLIVNSNITEGWDYIDSY